VEEDELCGKILVYQMFGIDLAGIGRGMVDLLFCLLATILTELIGI